MKRTFDINLGQCSVRTTKAIRIQIFMSVKVRLIEGVKGDMKSIDGDKYLISTFMKDYEEIKIMQREESCRMGFSFSE